MPIFPGGKAVDSDLFIAVNNVATQLNGAVDASQTNITVTDTTAFPANGYVTIGVEAIKYTSKNATQFLGLTRGADGTLATTHLTLDVVFHAVIADHHNVLKDEVIAVEEDLFDTVKPQQVLNTADLEVLRQNVGSPIVNAGLELWERATSFNNPNNETFVADNWRVQRNGGSTFVVSKETGAVNVDSGPASMKFDLQIVGGATFLYFENRIENFKDYVGKTVTMSARIKTTSGILKLQISDGVTGTKSASHSGSGDYETLTVTHTLSGSSTQFNAQIGYFSPSLLATNIAYIDSVTMTIGTQALPFFSEQVAVELTKAQRTFEKSTANVVQALGRSDGVNFQLSNHVSFKVEKPAIPIITLTINLVSEEGGTADEQGSYTEGTTQITIHGFNFRVFKNIAGAKPAGYDFDWEAEA